MINKKEPLGLFFYKSYFCFYLVFIWMLHIFFIHALSVVEGLFNNFGCSLIDFLSVKIDHLFAGP